MYTLTTTHIYFQQLFTICFTKPAMLPSGNKHLFHSPDTSMWEKIHLRPALVCNYNGRISTIIGYKTTTSLRILYTGMFLFFILFFYTNRSFDLVNSALGVNTDMKSTNSGCNPALGQNHAVWISSTPTSQPEHWRSQWGLPELLALIIHQDRSKPPNPYAHNILLCEDHRNRQKRQFIPVKNSL